jgi:hypothetical protein
MDYRKVKFVQHHLKTFIKGETLCFCFSGNFAYKLTAIAAIANVISISRIKWLAFSNC